jgi:hypothetical protein
VGCRWGWLVIHVVTPHEMVEGVGDNTIPRLQLLASLDCKDCVRFLCPKALSLNRWEKM